jgi:protoporphyrinogen oxidase
MSMTDFLTTEILDTLPNGKRKAIIIGAGPAGLTAAYELLKRTDIVPIILEKSGDIGGISKTVNYKGNRIDIGGHRFFSKSDRVMNWWFNIMPVEAGEQNSFNISYQHKSREVHITNADPKNSNGTDPDKVMLVRRRLSRIYFLRKFFTYPIQLSFDTLNKLGVWPTITILCSYLKAQLLPRKPERNLEDFMINRFGRTLYKFFFKDYTEKVWGRPCNTISAEWGAQRIKGVSISKAIQHAVQTALKRKQKGRDITQKDTETSLIEQFLYPKYGPGQLWEEVARQVTEMGGKILMHQDVKRIYPAEGNNRITAVAAVNNITGETSYLEGDYFVSTMPVQELIGGMDGSIPDDVLDVAAGLQYRDFITVGILLRKLSFQDKKTGEWKPLELKDTWIYIQERDVKVGRLQLFNNWSPFMVRDPDTVWVGMEFFCNQEDNFWQLPDNAIKQIAIHELEKIGLACDSNVLDSTVLRMEKTYPAYFGTYERFDVVRKYVDGFENLFLVGRNGMHKYNNSDHSMLTAMVAVDNICGGVVTKENIWAINTEQEYHEERVTTQQSERTNHALGAASESQLTFKDFVLNNPQNRKLLWIVGISFILLFSIFKYFYPFPSFIHDDSFVYLQMAANNANIETYPVGYPRFLRLFSVFSDSDTALTAFQYFFVQSNALFLLFTLFYFYSPGKVMKGILLSFTVLNPLALYLANLVSTDAIFLGLSLTWFALLIWIVNRPNCKIVIAHSLVLFLAFTFRYNALIYPIMAVAAFGVSSLSIRKKLAGILAGFILCGIFISYTGNKYKDLTGSWQFSPFSGWQLANNAMYTYRYVDSADRRPVPDRFKVLDNMIRTYFDSTRDVRLYPLEGIKASTAYMWSPGLPLMKYMENQYAKDTVASSFKKWALMGPFYRDYGSFIIKQYPLTFAKYFLWPNAQKYYAPPVEFLERYNDGRDSIGPIAQYWFGYKSRKVKAKSENAEVYALGFYPILSGVMNVLFLCGLVCFAMLDGFRGNLQFRKVVFMGIVVWIANATFTIFASPAALRFQSFQIILVTIFSMLFIDWMLQSVKVKGNTLDKRDVASSSVSTASLAQV